MNATWGGVSEGILSNLIVMLVPYSLCKNHSCTSLLELVDVCLMVIFTTATLCNQWGFIVISMYLRSIYECIRASLWMLTADSDWRRSMTLNCVVYVSFYLYVWKVYGDRRNYTNQSIWWATTKSTTVPLMFGCFFRLPISFGTEGCSDELISRNKYCELKNLIRDCNPIFDNKYFGMSNKVTHWSIRIVEICTTVVSSLPTVV